MEIVQVGGRYLDGGEYGCIFQPPLITRCRSKPTPGKLGKITKPEFLLNEAIAAQVLHREEAKKYFILPELKSICAPTPLEQQTEKDLSACKVIRKEKGVRDMLQYEMDFGGKTMSKVLHSLKFSPKEFPFEKILLQLLEMGAYLALHGYVHNDLHSSNMVLDDKMNARAIDFGRSYKATMINEKLIEKLAAHYDMTLGQVTPESSAQDGIEEGYSFRRILEDLRTKKPGILNAERFLGLSRSAQAREFQAFWLSSRTVQRRDWVGFLRLYWPVVDSWSIGHMVLNILSRLLYMREFTESSYWKQKGGVVREMLRGLMRASPRERSDCVEALAILDPTNKLVTSDSARAWLTKKEEQRRKIKRGGAASNDVGV